MRAPRASMRAEIDERGRGARCGEARGAAARALERNEARVRRPADHADERRLVRALPRARRVRIDIDRRVDRGDALLGNAQLVDERVRHAPRLRDDLRERVERGAASPREIALRREREVDGGPLDPSCQLRREIKDRFAAREDERGRLRLAEPEERAPHEAEAPQRPLERTAERDAPAEPRAHVLRKLPLRAAQEQNDRLECRGVEIGDDAGEVARAEIALQILDDERDARAQGRAPVRRCRCRS